MYSFFITLQRVKGVSHKSRKIYKKTLSNFVKSDCPLEIYILMQFVFTHCFKLWQTFGMNSM